MPANQKKKKAEYLVIHADSRSKFQALDRSGVWHASLSVNLVTRIRCWKWQNPLRCSRIQTAKSIWDVDAKGSDQWWIFGKIMTKR